MTYTEKGTCEDFIVQELEKLGWRYVKPEDMKQIREENFEEALVLDKLRSSIRRINNRVEFTEADLDFIITSLRSIPSNIDGIEKFLDVFRNGLVVPLQREGKEEVIRLVDLDEIENNDFIVTNQYKVEGTRGTIKADVVLLVNGIPLVLIECKSPTREDTWSDAYEQIKRYEEQAPDLFKYVQFSIATDGIKTSYFPNAFNERGKDFPSVWKDPYPFKAGDFRDDILKITIHGLLSKQNLLDLVENFTFIRKEGGKNTKIMARYMQFRASNKIFRRVIDTLRKKEEKKFGLIWHWQGSGKTYTMAFAAWKLLRHREAGNPSIFVMVDRKDLEEQIEKDFSFINVPIEKVNSINHLIELLKWGDGGKRGIFLVTVEKFSPREFTELEEGKGIEIERENVIVFADEVHRTQYGKFATLWRSIFKNAHIFGFTGTPLSKAERNTFQKFSPKGELYLDRYSMLDALADGFTVPLRYQARLPEYHLKEEQLREFVEFEEEEIRTLSKQEQRELRKKVKVIKTFVKKPERIRAIAEDIANHFKEVVETTELKALVVAIDREACVMYKNAIDEFLPQEYSEIVMTFSPNDPPIIRDYFERMVQRYGMRDAKEMNKRVIEDFKTRKGAPKILIVTDMLITGFDAPSLWAMYIDKPLKEHRALQAIARTNRPFLNKKFGLIVDYIGVLKELESAFAQFESPDARDLRVVIRDLSKEKEEFVQNLERALNIFQNVKMEDTHESLEAVMNVLINPEVAKNFEDTMRELMRSYEMLQGDPFLRPYLSRYTLLTKIYVLYNKRFKKANIDELKIEELSKKTSQLIQQAIDIKQIEDAYPTITIDEKYIEALRKSMPKDIGAAIDILANIQYEARAHPTSPFFVSLSKEVERTYEELRNRRIETEEAVRRALDFSERIAKWKREEQEIGKDKYPLYEAIRDIVPEIEKEKAVNFVKDLLIHLGSKGLLFDGWKLQRDVRHRVRVEIRLLLLSKLKEYKNKIDQLTDSIFARLEEIK